MIPAETALFTAFEVTEALRAKQVSGGFSGIAGVSIDSRTCRQGELFIPLSGEHTDGHLYLEDVLAGCAAGAFCKEDYYSTHRDTLLNKARENQKVLIIVHDPLEALQTLAAYHLSRFPALVRIGITGSSGKTTTKECLAAMLGEKYETVSNCGNLNSEIGLPLAVLSVQQHHEVGVFEMGISRPGEMQQLSGVFKPQHAVVTQIGKAHIGNFPDQKSIAYEKKAIFAHFSDEGMAFVWEDDPFVQELTSNIPGKVMYFGPRNNPDIGRVQNLGIEGWQVEYAGISLHLRLPGEHNVLNFFAALRVARELGVSPGDIKRGIENVEPGFGRSQFISGNPSIMLDCYNANPESVRSFLKFLPTVLPAEGRSILVLGDMLELGTLSEAEHVSLSSLVESCPVNKVFLFGAAMRSLYEVLTEGGDVSMQSRYVWEDNFEELYQKLSFYITPDDFLAIKGSRGNRLERIAENLTKRKAEIC